MDLVITLSQILRSCVSIDKHCHICLRSQHPFVELILSLLKASRAWNRNSGVCDLLRKYSSGKNSLRKKVKQEKGKKGKGRKNQQGCGVRWSLTLVWYMDAGYMYGGFGRGEIWSINFIKGKGVELWNPRLIQSLTGGCGWGRGGEDRVAPTNWEHFWRRLQLWTFNCQHNGILPLGSG